MVSVLARLSSGPRHGRLGWLVAVTVVVLTAVWAVSAGGPGDAAESHHSPAHVEAVPGTDLAHVTITEEAALRIGLQVVEVRAGGIAGRTVVPGDALVYGVDGTTWVYVERPKVLTFQREVVKVHTITATDAVLRDGPPVGTRVVGVGSAELYGTESGVGH